MRRAILAGVTFGAAVFVAPVAHGTAPDVVHGGCRWDMHNQHTATGVTYVGYEIEQSTTTTGDSPSEPISATVTCWVAVNGEPVPGTVHSFGDVGPLTGYQAGAVPIMFDAADYGGLAGCESDAFADGTTREICYSWLNIEIPPQAVVDTENGVCETLELDDCPSLETH